MAFNPKSHFAGLFHRLCTGGPACGGGMRGRTGVLRFFGCKKVRKILTPGAVYAYNIS